MLHDFGGPQSPLAAFVSQHGGLHSLSIDMASPALPMPQMQGGPPPAGHFFLQGLLTLIIASLITFACCHPEIEI